jgi:hypothetical protein
LSFSNPYFVLRDAKFSSTQVFLGRGMGRRFFDGILWFFLEWLAFYFPARFGEHFGEHGVFGVVAKVSISHFGEGDMSLCGLVFGD